MTSALRGQRGTLVLIAIALGLGLTWFLTRGKVTTSEQEARSFNVLLSYREDDVSEISLENQGKRWTLKRQAPDDAGTIGWDLTEPVKEEADAYAVDKLLGSLEYARVIRRIKPEEVDRAGFGLDAASWRMKVGMGKIRYTLALGKEAAQPRGARYLELTSEGGPGSGVMLVSGDLVKELDIDASTLRGRQMLPYTSNSLSSIVIVGTDGIERKLASMGHDRWRFQGMQGDYRLSRDAFDQVLVQFAHTKAEHFIDTKEAEAALKNGPVVTLTLIPKDTAKPKAVIVVGGQCPSSDNDVVALRKEPDAVGACVPKAVLPGLDTAPEALVDKYPFSLRKDEVESLRLARGEKKLELDRKESGFVMRAPAKADIELEAGNRRIDSMVRTEGKLIASPNLKELGLDPPAGHVTVRSAAESEASVVEESIDLGKRDKDGKLAIRRTSDGAVLELDAEGARAFEPDSTLVRSRSIFNFSIGDFRSLEITSKALHQKFHREASGQFVLDIPKGMDHDAGLATALVDDLGSLSADRWVADSDDGSFGLSDPTVRAKIEFANGDAGVKEHTLSVGAFTTGGAFAKLDDDPGIFVIPRKVADELSTWVLDRAVFMLTPDNAARVDIEHGGKKLSLEKKGDAFVRSGGLELSPARLAEISDTLIALRAEAAVHIGPAKPGEGMQKPELVITSDKKKLSIGAGDDWQGTSIYYARAEGVDATFVIAKSKVRAILDAF